MPSTPFDELRAAIETETPIARVTVVRGEPLGGELLVYEDGRVSGSLGDETLDRAAIEAGRQGLAMDESGLTPLGEDVEAFVEVFARPPHLVVVGGVHTAIALSKIGKLLGFRVTVVDPRERFANPERFPAVDEIIAEWPDEALARLKIDSRTYIAILTHDPKFDEPAIVGSLATAAPYIGAVGSRKTNRDRRVRLREAGVTDDQLARVHGPIGLDIGAETPEEMAISILAEIIAARHGRSGGPLTEATGSIRGAPES
jgi:xanthine dehydrogenase accessory factor